MKKVGKLVEEAIFANPACTLVFQKVHPVSEAKVKMGPILDVPTSKHFASRGQAFFGRIHTLYIIEAF